MPWTPRLRATHDWRLPESLPHLAAPALLPRLFGTAPGHSTMPHETALLLLAKNGGRRPWRTHGQFPQDATAGRRRPHHSVRCTAQSQSPAAKLTARSRVSSPWTLLIVTVPASSAGSREFSATDAVWPASIGSIVLEPQPVSTVTAELAASASLVTET